MACAMLAAIPLALGAKPSGSLQIARRATPQPSPTATPMPTPSPTPYLQSGDRAYALIGGEWTCKTFAGTAFTRTYRRDEDAVSMIGETDVPIAGHIGKLIEVYRKHSNGNKWVVSLVGGQIVAVAKPWQTGDWIFEGHDSEPGHDTRMRMIYRTYGDSAFRREFERFVNGQFTTYAGEKCARKVN
jgi:hypothetical protein